MIYFLSPYLTSEDYQKVRRFAFTLLYVARSQYIIIYMCVCVYTNFR